MDPFVPSSKGMFMSPVNAQFSVVPMSDSELEAIKRRKMRELERKLIARPESARQIDADEVLARIFRERAWEVFNTASSQYPDVMRKLKATLVELALSGRLKEVTGEQLYSFLRKLGLNVKLNTRISFAEDGRLKSLSDKIKEDLKVQ